MNLFWCIFVLLAVVQASESKSVRPKYTERISVLTPFYLRQRAGVQPGIVGGNPAEISNFPHHLALLDLSFGGYMCGASNIGSLWALSAAHCLDFDTPATSINLWGGSTSRLTGGTVFFITEYINHPQYDPWTVDNDISLLRVDPSTPLTGVQHVSPITIPENCAGGCCTVCVAGPDITVTGWGANNLGLLPINLRQVQKGIYDHTECIGSWLASVWRLEITPQMFCTVVENGRDSCNGDSGGPVVRSGVQVGVVSFGSEDCGDGSLPAVYVRIEALLVRDWIRTVSGI